MTLLKEFLEKIRFPHLYDDFEMTPPRSPTRVGPGNIQLADGLDSCWFFNRNQWKSKENQRKFKDLDCWPARNPSKIPEILWKSSEFPQNPGLGRLGIEIFQISRAELARAGRADGKLAETVGALQIGSKTIKMNCGNDALDGCRRIES